MSNVPTITLALLLGFQSGWLASTRFRRRLPPGGNSGNDRANE